MEDQKIKRMQLKILIFTLFISIINCVQTQFIKIEGNYAYQSGLLLEKIN